MSLQEHEITIKIIIGEIVKRNLTGYVEISTPGEIIIKYALIEISGIAACSFKLDKNKIKRFRFYRKCTKMSGEQTFYYSRHTLCGGNIAHKHKGVENYEFSCGWPTRLPASWTGDYGSIKYLGKITVIANFGQYEHTQEIIVSSQRDLKLEKHLMFESIVRIHKPFHFMKHFGSIDIDLWIPFSGAAIKQSIPVSCSIENNSNVMFGSLIFVLTRIDIYRATKPFNYTKTVRTDVCRIPKMVNITCGKFDYYCVLETDENTLTTNQFHSCTCVQIIYEIWVSIQGAFPRFGPYGYPNIDTPGIPIIIGTKPIYKFKINNVNNNVFQRFCWPRNSLSHTKGVDSETENLIHTVEEEIDENTRDNLNRQISSDENLQIEMVHEVNISTKSSTDKMEDKIVKIFEEEIVTSERSSTVQSTTILKKVYN